MTNLTDLTNWKPIDSAPRDGKPFLAVCGKDILCIHLGEFKDRFVVYNPECGCCLDRCIVDPTWWTDLPDLPQSTHVCQNNEFLCKRVGDNLYLRCKLYSADYIHVNYCPLCGVKE